MRGNTPEQSLHLLDEEVAYDLTCYKMLDVGSDQNKSDQEKETNVKLLTFLRRGPLSKMNGK